MNRLLQELNDAQRQAVTTTEGPLLVIAGAGSGKTRVLTRRLAYILTSRLARPYELLAVTFTNKAAQEMKERVARLLGSSIPELQISTFHSFCARLLRREAAALGYDSSFTIFDAADSETLIKNCIKELGLSTEQFPAKAQLRKISNAKNQFIGPEQYSSEANGYFEETTAKLYLYYQQRLRECNAMDFDDLLFNTVWLLKNNPEIGKQYQQRFRYIMVDEYQDTNHVQYLLLKSIVGEHRNICVVGDEDQSIYGWRGADIRNILDFETDFPGAEVIKLEMNYRSTDVILKAASGVIKNNTARKEKTLRTNQTGGDKISLFLVNSADEESASIVEQVLQERMQYPLKEMAVLYRTNAQSRPLEERLRRQSIPYQIVGGISFYQRKEIKDLMAYLKLIVNMKDDVSLLRAINYPKRGIGNATVAAIQALATQNHCSLYEIMQEVGEYPELSKKQERISSFVEFIEAYRRQHETKSVDLLVMDLVKELKLVEELLAEDKILGQTRVENIEAFIEGTADYVKGNPHAVLADYLAEISLYTNLDEYAEDDDKLTLMTLHAAKGLEYDVVFLVGLEEGLFPLGQTVNDPFALEEERRLFYVGATRARKKLYLSSSTTRHRFNTVVTTPSRFIKEIDPELVEVIDNRNRSYMSTTAGSGRKSFLSGGYKQPHASGMQYEYEGEDAIRVGRIVHHPTFGRGKVFKTEGSGEALVLEIQFAGVGLKRIMAKYGKLRIIG